MSVVTSEVKRLAPQSKNAHHYHWEEQSIVVQPPQKKQKLDPVAKASPPPPQITRTTSEVGSSSADQISSSSLLQAMSITTDFPQQAAGYFPDLLAYFHGSPSFKISRQNAVALRYLANHFKISNLQEQAWDFIKQDMAIGNLQSYLAHATEFQDTQTATWVAFECARNILQVDPVVICQLCPCDFEQMIFLVRNCRTGNPIHTSELIATYCAVNCSTKKIDHKWFQSITSKDNLPVISERAALTLLQIEINLVGAGVTPSCLQQRCIEALQKAEGK